MTEMIKDGYGRSYLAKVNKINQLHVASVNVSMEHFANHIYGKAWNILFDTSVAAGSDKCFFYLKNNGNKSLIFEGITIRCSSNCVIYGHFNPIGTPLGVSACTVANLNIGSNNIPDADIYYGSDITGLTNGSLFIKGHFASSNQSIHMNFNADIIIPSNGIVTMYTETGGFDISVILIGYEDIEGEI